uniref:hypothetical protein n=1 Tax=Flavobacterium sp. TaxID=239 RepID=UPI00404A065F
MIKKTLLIVLLTTFNCFSQSNSDTRVQVSAIPAFASFDFGSLNRFLSSAGLPEVKDGLQFMPAFTIASPLSSYGIIMDVTAGFGNTTNSSNGNSLENQTIFSEIGFSKEVFNENRKTIFVGLAIGSVWQTVDIYNNVDAGSFAGSLAQFEGAFRLSSKNNQYFAIKSGFDWAIDDEEDILIGLRVGYRIGFSNEKWKINGQTYSDSPEASSSGFFMGLALSFR